MLLRIQDFGGIAPGVHPTKLAPNQAASAANCFLQRGVLQALPAPSDIGAGGVPFNLNNAAGLIRTIFRFGRNNTAESNYWLSFLAGSSMANDTDVCRGQIANDASFMTYYTINGVAYYTNTAIATTNYPTTPSPALGYLLGVPAPTIAPTLTLGAAPTNPTSTIETTYYVYTFVINNAYIKMESAPSPVSAAVNVYRGDGQTVGISGMATAIPGAYEVAGATKRIYRTSTGGGSGNFLYVTEVPLAQATFNGTVGETVLGPDNVKDTALGNVIPSTYWYQPPTNVVSMVNMPNGIMAMASGASVYFCDPYHPYAYPAANVVTLDYDIVGLGVYQNTLVALTTGMPYVITGTTSASMTPLKVNLMQSCASKRSIVSTGDGVLYASPDGLAYIGAAGPKLLTGNVFTRATWSAFCDPTTIRANMWNDKYVAFFTTTGGYSGFIFDPKSNNAPFMPLTMGADAGYTDPQTDILYLVFNRTLQRFYVGGTTYTNYNWTSKLFEAQPKSYMTVARVVADNYPVMFDLLADGVSILGAPRQVMDNKPFRLPVGRRARTFQVVLSQYTAAPIDPAIHYVVVASSVAELLDANG